MEKKYEIEESKYKADFMISENYIKFSAELLRLSLLAIGGFGTLLIKIKKADYIDPFPKYEFFIIALICFVICSGASLCHRYYATDAMSWHIDLLRAQNNGDVSKVKKERAGLHKTLKFSRISLISSEISFGFGVIFFFIAILNYI